jgi:hypothetical protein
MDLGKALILRVHGIQINACLSCTRRFMLLPFKGHQYLILTTYHILSSFIPTSPFCFQNSYIGYDVLQKLAIPQPKQYLEVLESVTMHLLSPLSLSLSLSAYTVYLIIYYRPDIQMVLHWMLFLFIIL